jgi:hypothetical protein
MNKPVDPERVVGDAIRDVGESVFAQRYIALRLALARLQREWRSEGFDASCYADQLAAAIRAVDD